MPCRAKGPGALALPFSLSEHSGVLFSPAGKGAEGVLSDCSQACALPSLGSPSPRWCHAMCLSDLGTAVLIGGEGVNQQSCRDALWKLEIGGDFRVVKSHGVLEEMGGNHLCLWRVQQRHHIWHVTRLN